MTCGRLGSLRGGEGSTQRTSGLEGPLQPPPELGPSVLAERESHLGALTPDSQFLGMGWSFSKLRGDPRYGGSSPAMLAQAHACACIN